ncbi:hypothetical protein BMS3Abin15_00395 [bacterium BMS3Abin15]|nr:hypothetical protein BMS3Abin15_00395 [bacterium BMS3Abin15]HDZ85917.1 hypothetical protein [Candidatus Moranbacteria bacterium]
MWNPFKKNDSKISPVGGPKMGMLQKLAMKRLEKMNPEEREKLMKKALDPENIAKNQDKILTSIEQMKASGQITEEQAEMAKKKLGL